MKAPPHTVALSPTMRRLLVELQTWCSADCCKDKAFTVSAAAISRWLNGERVDRTQQLVEEVARVQADLQRTGDQVVLDARGLESDWPGDEFRAFWDRFAVALASASAVAASGRESQWYGGGGSRAGPRVQLLVDGDG